MAASHHVSRAAPCTHRSLPACRQDKVKTPPALVTFAFTQSAPLTLPSVRYLQRLGISCEALAIDGSRQSGQQAKGCTSIATLTQPSIGINVCQCAYSCLGAAALACA